MNKTLLFALTFGLCSAALVASVIATRLDDPKAIYLDTLPVDVHSSAGLQAAIDKAAGTGREGIVFAPAGRYALTRTVYLWPGVRLIGGSCGTSSSSQRDWISLPGRTVAPPQRDRSSPVSPDRTKRSAAAPREETDDEFQRAKHLPPVA